MFYISIKRALNTINKPLTVWTIAVHIFLALGNTHTHTLWQWRSIHQADGFVNCESWGSGVIVSLKTRADRRDKISVKTELHLRANTTLSNRWSESTKQTHHQPISTLGCDEQVSNPVRACFGAKGHTCHVFTLFTEKCFFNFQPLPWNHSNYVSIILHRQKRKVCTAENWCSYCDRMSMYLFIDPAVGWSVVNKDLDYVHVTSPRCQMQRKTSLAVRHICRSFILQQLQHHVPERKMQRTHFLVILKCVCHF